MSEDKEIKYGEGILQQIGNSNIKSYTKVREELDNMSKEDIEKLMEENHKKYMENHSKGKDFKPLSN